jgi:proline iminopeptidase
VQLVYFDHRGHGRSARGPRETYTMENNVEDMEALRQYLGLEKIVLYGQSYGGMVALSYATRYPHRLSHLIAVVTVPDYRFLARAREILAERGTDEQQRVAERLWAGTFETKEQLDEFFFVMGPLYGRTFDPNKWNERRGRQDVTTDAINEAFGGFLRTYNATDDLHKIACPTLVIAGRHDWICAPEWSELIASKIPHADLRIFEESAHYVSNDEPEAFLDVIRGFLVYHRAQA